MAKEKKGLVLFTATYPYGTGEVFVEHEISFLSQAFETITIFPQNTDFKERRTTPANVTVVAPKAAVSNNPLTTLLSVNFIREVFVAGFHPRKLWVAYKSLQRATQILNSIKAEAISTTDNIFYSYWLDDAAIALALLKQQLPTANCISRAHGWDVYYYRHQPAYLPFRPMLAKFLNSIYVISENGRRYIQERVAERDTGKIHVARLGCKDFAEGKAPRLQTDPLRIVSCSSAISLKRIHLIVQALALVNDIQIEWVHFGDGPLLQDLKTMAQEQLAGKQNVSYKFFGHAVSAQIIEHYKTAAPSLFINASETEGIPVSIMEAQCFGIAALGPNVGGIPEIVEDKVNGFLLSPNPQPNEIAVLLKQYYAMSHTEKEQLKINARKTWKTKYNATVNYKAFIAAIQQ